MSRVQSASMPTTRAAHVQLCTLVYGIQFTNAVYNYTKFSKGTVYYPKNQSKLKCVTNKFQAVHEGFVSRLLCETLRFLSWFDLFKRKIFTRILGDQVKSKIVQHEFV